MPSNRSVLSRASLAGALLFLIGFLATNAAAQPAVPASAARCAACHGSNGNSLVPSIPSLAGQPKIFLENHLVLIREGMRDIPAMKGQLDGLSDKELAALADYFSAQTPAAPRTTPQAAMFERGQQIAKGMLCASCHESNFAGRQQMPRLAAQHETYLRDVMKQFRDHPAPGRDTVMSASLLGLKDADLADLAHYLAHLK
jgi:cytochrome c553